MEPKYIVLALVALYTFLLGYALGTGVTLWQAKKSKREKHGNPG